VDILERGEATDRVTVDRRVPDGELALVASGQDEMAVLVGQRHDEHTSHARLDVLGRDAAHVDARAERVDESSDRDGGVVQAGPLGQIGSVGARVR